MEKWKNIRGYEGLYQVSNLGRVKSLNYKRTNKPGILKLGVGGSGYPHVNLCRSGKGKTARVHILVAEAFYRPRQTGEVIMHLDNDKTNNCLSNLKIGTQAENIKQSFDDGRISAMRGEKHWKNILSEAQVTEIKGRFGYRNNTALAREYGVSECTIRDIRSGRRWGHLENSKP